MSRQYTEITGEVGDQGVGARQGSDKPVRDYISSNRELLKTRLLDVSDSLHSEVDRPDAEATLRMAVWPPMAVVVIYLAIDVSMWWAFAVVFPLLLAWQWLALRTHANDELVAAVVARKELREQAEDHVRRIISAAFRQAAERSETQRVADDAARSVESPAVSRQHPPVP